MPAERRSLRSNKSDASTNGDKARSNSQSSGSNAKDKPAPTRSTSGRSKPQQQPKKGTGKTAAMGGDKQQQQQQQPNGSQDPVENGVTGSEDVEMGDQDVNGDTTSPSATKQKQDEDGDDEMTVVVPPSKVSKNSAGGDNQDDVTMEGTETEDEKNKKQEVTVDPAEKAAADIKANFTLLQRAVTHFDPRFTLRVLRSISSVRKQLTPDLLAQVIVETYPRSDSTAQFLLAALDKGSAFDNADADTAMDTETDSKSASRSSSPKDVLPEVGVYISILVQVYLYDQKNIQHGAKFSTDMVGRLQSFNRRTLDSLSAKVYFYYSLFYEQMAPHPPSPAAAVISIRQQLLGALRTAVLRKDTDVQATVTNLLLRNYLSASHISQADLFISHSEFPADAANNQIARYLYYLGRIRSIQLQYTEAHQHLIGATRKSPSNHIASGFYQASTKLLVVVELLMGDIPDRAVFRQPAIERAMYPYLLLVQAVSVGDLEGFQKIVQAHSPTFRRDGTYTLILRLRQNVIKTGIRMMSLSYTRISLRDICLRLGLDSEESAEYIVGKAIRDGVIEATLDHESGYMKSKDVGDVYATQEPGEVFHERILACLGLHDESVKAMRYPMNQHRLELKNAQEARDRERELAKEIVDGDMDDDDEAGGDFEGM